MNEYIDNKSVDFKIYWISFIDELKKELNKLFQINKYEIINSKNEKIRSRPKRVDITHGDFLMRSENRSIDRQWQTLKYRIFDNHILIFSASVNQSNEINVELPFDFSFKTEDSFIKMHSFLYKNYFSLHKLKTFEKIFNIYKETFYRCWDNYKDYFEFYKELFSVEKNSDFDTDKNDDSEIKYFQSVNEKILFHFNILDEEVESGRNTKNHSLLTSHKFLMQLLHINDLLDNPNLEITNFSKEIIKNSIDDVQNQLKKIKYENVKKLVTTSDLDEFKKEIYILIRDFEDMYKNPYIMTRKFKKIKKFINTGLLVVTPALIPIAYKEIKEIDHKADTEEFKNSVKEINIEDIYK